jgi:hypothetical protein
MEAFDLFDPFLISTWIDPDAISVLDCWGDRKHDGIDLTKQWSKLLLKYICAWKRDTFGWCTDEDDLTSMEWVKEFLTNSCDINLVKHIEEKFDQLFEYEHDLGRMANLRTRRQARSGACRAEATSIS